MTKAQAFFDRYGPKTVLLARFVPVVRTFTPIVAGVSRMGYRTLVVYNVIGGVAWGLGVTLAGFFLGQVDFVQAHLEIVILSVVTVSALPIGIELLPPRRATGSVMGSETAARPTEPPSPPTG